MHGSRPEIPPTGIYRLGGNYMSSCCTPERGCHTDHAAEGATTTTIATTEPVTVTFGDGYTTVYQVGGDHR